MLSENGEQLSPKSPAGSEHATQKQSKISYTREFLLSLSELDSCKKLPNGFDSLVLSELVDSSNNTLERQRNYGSSLPNRLEASSNYSRGSTGRWDTRSGGSSDRDGDSACDGESSTQDSGKRFVNQTRKVWQNSEQDGLLGSGGFSRSPGYTGAIAPKTRGNGQYQLSRSTEPYQPPRPYKAAPYSRKDHTDSFNDETFGSSECSSQDRAEEERKRRASFELMRKEQHKALQEKQKQKSENQKAKRDTNDISAPLENSEVGKSPRNENNISEDSLALSLLQNDSSRSSQIQLPAFRPLVPPGFASAPMEKNISVQSSSISLLPEDDGFNSARVPSVQANENNVISSSGELKHSVDFGNVSRAALDIQDTTEVWADVVNKEEVVEVANAHYALSHNHSTSVLEKLFSSVLSKDYSSSSNYIESQAVISDEGRWSPAISDSSKFAHLFLDEEDKKPKNDWSSRDLLSLINGERAVPAISSNKVIENNDPLEEFIASSSDPSFIGIPEKRYPPERLPATSGVLTCEDLEQFIMAEVKESSSILEESMGARQSGVRPEEQKVGVDELASQHLLSLLQRGTNTKESDGFGITDNIVSNTETVHGGSEKTLTLEALFGTAFMNELQSVEAPLSVKRGSGGEVINATPAHDLQLEVVDEGILFSVPKDLNLRTHEGKLAATNHTQEEKGQATAGPWIRNVDSLTENSKVGADIHLPEEDSLISVGDSLDPPIVSEPSPFTNTSEELVHGKTTMESLSDKLLSALFRDGERLSTNSQEGPRVSRGMYDLAYSADNRYNNNIHDQSPLQYPHHMNHTRPLFPQSDYHAQRHPQMRFMGSDNFHHHPRHQFSENIVPQHAFHGTRGQHQMMEHMAFPVNSPHRQPLHDFPRGVPLSHPINHMPYGYMPEMSNMHNFPLHHQQPNFQGPGLGIPGVGGSMGPSRTEALEKLIEMEMRANSKQFHPSGGGHIPGIYGPDVGMNFRYR